MPRVLTDAQLREEVPPIHEGVKDLQRLADERDFLSAAVQRNVAAILDALQALSPVLNQQVAERCPIHVYVKSLTSTNIVGNDVLDNKLLSIQSSSSFSSHFTPLAFTTVFPLLRYWIQEADPTFRNVASRGHSHAKTPQNVIARRDQAIRLIAESLSHYPQLYEPASGPPGGTLVDIVKQLTASSSLSTSDGAYAPGLVYGETTNDGAPVGYKHSTYTYNTALAKLWELQKIYRDIAVSLGNIAADQSTQSLPDNTSKVVDTLRSAATWDFM